MELSLVQLIRQRMQDLDITRGELARRMGYSNIRKGCRRIAMICAGDLSLAETLRDALSRGLGVDLVNIDRSIDTSGTELMNVQDADFRQSFKPHAVVVTVLGETEYFPCMVSPTLKCSMREARMRIINFTEGSPPETYAVQACEALTEDLPLFMGSSTRGYVVNYSPDCALCFDKEGKPIESLSEALRIEVSGRYG